MGKIIVPVPRFVKSIAESGLLSIFPPKTNCARREFGNLFALGVLDEFDFVTFGGVNKGDATGGESALALLLDGTVVAWGDTA